ncbi:MAG: universal stress protein E [Pseudohongiellaceae bacterium]|jgi:universal stress protein E
MLTLKKIIVVIEPDQDEQPALEKATELANCEDCELELALADYNPFLEDGYFYEPKLAQQMRREHGEARLEQLEALAQPLRDQGLCVTAWTSWSNPPHSEIVARAKEIEAAMVIKATKKHSRLARYFMSNEDWELVRYCPVPLLLVKDKPWSANPRLVAAVDPEQLRNKPADLDNKILSASLEFARLTGGSVDLYHSSWKPPMANLYPLDVEGARVNQAMAELAQAHGIPPERRHCIDENIHLSLPRLTQESGVSIVVMGAISRSRLDRILIGNTAEKLLDELRCDVLIIKPDTMPMLSQVLV